MTMTLTKKKEKEATLEEKLAQALVPDAEQPYPIPKNWCWGYLTRSFAECKDNYRKPINANERSGRIGNIPYYGATGQVGWIDDFLTDEELVLLGEDGAPFLDLVKDKAYLISGKAWVNNHAHILKSYFGHTGNLYLLNYLNLFDYKDYVNGTTRLKLTQSSMDTIPIPIAPLAEQKRIVDHIKNLFAKLDEAKEKAQAVIDGFEDRKAAILHKAFTGELTKEWKRQNAITEWQNVKLGTYLKPMETKKPSGEYFYYIDIDSIDNKRQIVQEPKKILSKDAPSRARRAVHYGDVLFSMVRPYLKNIAYIDESLKSCVASTGFYVCTPKESLDSQYLYYYLCSKDVIDYLMQFMKGDNSPAIKKEDLLEMEIQLPSLQEQKCIVNLLVAIIEKEQLAKSKAEFVLDQIDFMKKSILARAFRGKLGTNDPNDESAEELLRQTLETNSEKATFGTHIKKKTISTVQMAKTILEVLKQHDRISPENLKKETGLNVDDFYSELKKLIENNEIKETRNNYEVFLEMKDENRQAQN